MTSTESAAQAGGPTPWRHKRAVAWIVLVVLWLASVPIMSLVILLPLYGALVCHRAHYRPLYRNADPESKTILEAAKIPIRWYLAVFPRVWVLEGWAGMWKGAVPCIFYFAGLTVYQTAFDNFVGHKRNYQCIHRIIFLFASEVAWVPFSVPLIVVLNREITRPQLLDWARWRYPGRALSSLFSREELSQPKALLTKLFLPLLAAESVSTAVIWGANQAYLLLGTLGDQFIKDHGFKEPPPEFAYTREFFGKIWPWIVLLLILMLFKTLLAVVIVCPLEVAAVRISSQRAYPALDDISVQSAALVHEPVIRLRDAPYDGPLDCLRSIVREEGWRALCNAFWTTCLFTIHGKFTRSRGG